MDEEKYGRRDTGVDVEAWGVNVSNKYGLMSDMLDFELSYIYISTPCSL